MIETLQEGKLKHKTSAIIIVAEGDEEGNATQIANKVKEKTTSLDIKVTILGHIQRGGIPTAKDRILASRTGIAAVDGLLNDKKNVMAGVVHDKVVYTPFEDTISMKKPINEDLIKMVEILSI